MSLEKAKAFLDHVGHDSKLRAEVREPGRKALHEVLGLAKKHGFDVSPHDLHNALRERFGATHIPAATKDDEANCIFIAAR
jgi:predicted ribosomally synthesized peptide with nif11-like leader